MSKPVIETIKLGKRYMRHKQGEASYRTLRDQLSGMWKKRLQEEYFWALKDVDLEISEGEVIGIIGRNGAGKSTLLKLLGRITEPTTGQLTIRGKVASLLEVGTGFHPELSGRENIFLSGAILGMKQADVKKRFDEIVDFAGVGNFLDLPIKKYSSGMFLRLGFAVASHLDADILLVDEVLAVGDAEFQKKCLNKIGEVSKSGHTILLVSHQLESITHYCSKAILIENGILKQMGEVRDVTNGYLMDVFQTNEPKTGRLISKVDYWLDDKHYGTGTYLSKMRIEVAFDCSGEPIYNPVLGITIKNHRLNPIAGINNRWYDVNFPVKAWTKGSFCMTFGCTPLLPGAYSVDVHLGDKTGDRERIFDAFSFNLVALPDEKPNTNGLPGHLNMLRLPDVIWELQ